MVKLAPSLLAADFTRLADEIRVLEQEKVEILHLDIMDGQFVPNISYGPGLVKSLRPLTEMIFDVHLMIERPEQMIEAFHEAGADYLTFHWEAAKHPHRLIQQIKSLGMKVGISLNPGTSERVLDYVIEDLDLILIMSVNPGFGGQKLIPQSLDKLFRIREMTKDLPHDIILEIDGGIKTDNVHRALEAGANWIVSGSDVFGDKTSKQIQKYHTIFKNH